MPERIDASRLLTIVASALLLVSLFLHWYVLPGTAGAPARALGNAWSVFETLDIALAAIAGTSLILAYEQLTGRSTAGKTWLLPLGALALLIVVSQLLDSPPSISPAADPGTGAWFALAGSATLFVAGVLAKSKVSLALTLESARGERRRMAHEERGLA